MSKRLQRLLDSLDVFSEFDREDYQLLEVTGIGGSTENGIYINDVFLPFSQMRTDMEGNVYLANWLYAKEF